MSKHWIYSIGLSSLLAVSLHSWGSWREHAEASIPNASIPNNKFPLSESQGWFTEESYLILKPHADNLWYASKLGIEGSAGSHFDFKLKKETPDFGWYSGVRLNIGRYLPHHDHWDISLSTTYYYASTDDHSHANRSNDMRLTTRWTPLFSGPLNSSDVTWRLNYFTWDLSAARLYQMTEWLYVHPLIGLRTAYITQDYNSHSSGQFSLLVESIQLSQKFKADNDLWGIGPRIGTNLLFNFRRHWSLLGTLMGSLLFSNYDVKENFYGKIVRNGVQQIERDHVKENAFCVRANIEAALGLGWEKWVQKHQIRIAPSFLFEATEWFDVNHFFAIRRSPQSGDISFVAKKPPSGSLGLMGFSINLQVDF